MTIFDDATILYLPVIGLVAISILIVKKPSTCALLLLAESVLISLHFGWSKGMISAAFCTSILLSFFAMVLMGINLYFESSFVITKTKAPKINIFAGIILFTVFIYKIFPFLSENLIHHKIDNISTHEDALTILLSGFSLLSILVASIIIFEVKNPRTGGSL